jgi:hypothetical protein
LGRDSIGFLAVRAVFLDERFDEFKIMLPEIFLIRFDFNVGLLYTWHLILLFGEGFFGWWWVLCGGNLELAHLFYVFSLLNFCVHLLDLFL